MIGVGAGDVVTGTRTTLNSTDIIIDAVSGDGDILNVTASDDLVAGNAATVVGFENVNYTVQAFVTTTGTTFAIDNSGVASAAITIDVDQVGSSVVSTSITGVATDSTVTASSDFTTTVTVDGDDNAAVTVNAASAAVVAASAAGALTGATLTSTLSGTAAVVRFDTDSDAATVLTTTAADLEIDAVAATSVTATSSGSIIADQSVDATTENLTAATTVNLTAGDEIIAEMTAATAATLSAGFGDATTVTESVITGASLTTLNISGNGSAPRFDTTAADAVRTINITGSQNVTVEMDLVAVAALTTALSVTDSSTGTSRIILANTDAGAATNLSGVGADVIELAVANTRALTFASGAAVTISADQAAGTLDGADATAASNTLAITLDDGDDTANAADLSGVTITDMASVSIDASVDVQASTITSLTASADNTDVTINAGALGVTLATAVNLGTGDLVINSTAAVAGGATAITATSLTASGSGAVTLTAINSSNLATVTTGSGADALTISATGASLTLNSGAGNDAVIIGAATTASMTYTLEGGDGFDTLGLTDTVSYTAGTITESGFERIRLVDGDATSTDVTVANSLLDGSTYIMTTDGTAIVNTITVTLGTGEVSTDLSGLTFDNTFQAANDIVVLNAGGATGNLTLVGSDMINQFTGGTGNDTLTGGDAADVLNAGNGTNTITGGAGADALTGGTGVDTINGGADGDTITAGTGNDVITAGEGTDVVNGGAGADTIDLTETTSAADNVLVVALTDGGAAGTAAGTFTGFDVITGFTTGTDDIVFDGNTNGDDTVDTAIFTGAGGADEVVVAATLAVTASNDITISNYTSVDQVVNYINDLIANGNYVPDSTSTDLFVVTIGSGTSGTSVLYAVVDDGAAVDATEITLIATVNGVLTATDTFI